MRPSAKILGVIPARLAATRLPRKPLLPIAGVAMIERVYRGARQCGRLAELIVATDSEEIEAFCRDRSIPVAMTAPTHASGTDRVHEVMARSAAEVAVNIQGDEPLVRGEMIDALLEALFVAEEVEVATLSTPMNAEAAQEPGNVKVVTDAAGLALYFSRAPIPFPRDGATRFRKHLGYYAYSRAALDRFHGWPTAPLEQVEKLEQLRFLHHGVRIAVAETPWDSIGVDTPEDIARVEAHLRQERAVRPVPLR